MAVATAFFGYPSQPVLRRETVALAADRIGLSGTVNSVTWEELRIRGQLIIGQVLDAVDAAAVSVFDITDLNPNVLFELGYAIGSGRRVWLIRDGTDESAAQIWKRFGLLRSVGYAKYANSDQIVAAFERDRPAATGKPLFDDLIGPSLATSTPASLFYFKSLHDTDASRALTRVITDETNGQFSVTTADPAESSFQPLTWYAQQIFNSRTVVIHLTGRKRFESSIHNARCALIAGLARGIGKPLLLLAETDYSPPIDYEDLLHVYHSAKDCGAHARKWLKVALATEYGQSSVTAPPVSLQSELRSLRLGSYIAEDEKATLADYFVETRSYLEVLAGGTTVFVGRRGAGKSANLLQAADQIGRDKRNLVCVVKPPAYELDGIVRLLRQYAQRDEKGYLVESIWKFLLFSEIARTTADWIRSRPAPDPGSPDWALLELVDDPDGPVHPEFAVRLERAVESLLAMSPTSGVEAARVAISETLHQGILQQLRELLGAVLSGRRRVAILVDNLDKSWERGADLDELAFFLLGLLGCIRQVAAEFSRSDRWRKPVEVSLAVFIRTDIYGHVAALARERDKLPVHELSWADDELLLRVVEDRYAASKNYESPGSELWARYFPETIEGASTRSRILERIIHRPRDLVYVCNAAITNAVNRSHALVEERDVLDAEADYSHFALDSVIVETEASLPEIESILYAFAGAPVIVESEFLRAMLQDAAISSARVDDVIAVLRELSFLGVEVRPGQFVFGRDSATGRLAEAMASKLAADGPQRYQIHPAFWAYLELGRPAQAA